MAGKYCSVVLLAGVNYLAFLLAVNHPAILLASVNYLEILLVNYLSKSAGLVGHVECVLPLDARGLSARICQAPGSGHRVGLASDVIQTAVWVFCIA